MAWEKIRRVKEDRIEGRWRSLRKENWKRHRSGLATDRMETARTDLPLRMEQTDLITPTTITPATTQRLHSAHEHSNDDHDHAHENRLHLNGTHDEYIREDDDASVESEEVFSGSSLGSSEDDAEAPAGPSGFLVEIFEPHIAPEPVIAVSESDFVWNERPELPRSGMTDAMEAKPGFAGAVPLEKSLWALNSHGNTRAPSLEVREMGRGVSVNTDFPELVSSGLEAASRPMEVSFASYAPPDPAVLWEEAAKEFPRFETQLGDLGRLAFATLGWDEIARNEGITLPAAAPPGVAASVAPAETEPEEVRAAEPETVGSEVVEEVLSSAVEPSVAEPEKETEALSTEALNEVQNAPAIEAQPEADPVPSAITKPLPMTLHGHAPGRGKPVQVFPSVIARTSGIQIPRSNALPLRPSMVFGPAPATSKETAAREKAVTPALVEVAKPEVARKEAPAPPPAKKDVPASPARPDIKTLIKPGVQVRVAPPPEKKEAEKPAAAPAPPPTDKGKSDLAAFRKAEERKAEDRKAEERKAAEQKAEEQKAEERKVEARKAEERKAEEHKLEEQKAEERKAQESKTEARKADERKAEERRIEARKADERKAEELRKAREEAARKEADAKTKKEPTLPVPIAPSYTDMDLGLPSLGADRAAPQGFWSKLPVFAKASVGAAVLVAAVVGGLYYSKQGSSDAGPKGPTVVAAGNVLSSGGAGWDTDWAPDPPNSKRQRRVSLMNASQSLSDYRMELEGQIETKAMGWVFRASTPKNFYVEKIEIVKPGLNPTIQLVHFAVIDGVEQPHKAVPMTIPVRPDTMYKVRFEAIGDRFTTWVLDQKVDEWTDGRIGAGGVGLYAEAGESLSLKGGLNVVPLIVKH